MRTTEYNQNGNVLAYNITGVFFGAIAPDVESQIKIVDMEVDGATEIGNVQLGITATNMGGRSVPDAIFYDAKDTIAELNPDKPFPGVNASDTGTSPYNVPIGTLSAVRSKFVAIKIKAPSEMVNTCRVVFTWFFNYNLPLLGEVGLSSQSSGQSSSFSSLEGE